VQESEGEKKRDAEKLWEKRRGTNASLYWPKAGRADEAGSDDIPDAAGGEGGHGAAKPEGVIHRYRC
jgi:hypothetical protein